MEGVRRHPDGLLRTQPVGSLRGRPTVSGGTIPSGLIPQADRPDLVAAVPRCVTSTTTVRLVERSRMLTEDRSRLTRDVRGDVPVASVWVGRAVDAVDPVHRP